MLATGRTATGVTVYTASYTYASSDVSVATISTRGLVHTIAPGTTTITATELSSARSGIYYLVVAPAAVDSIRFFTNSFDRALPAGSIPAGVVMMLPDGQALTFSPYLPAQPCVPANSFSLTIFTNVGAFQSFPTAMAAAPLLGAPSGTTSDSTNVTYRPELFQFSGGGFCYKQPGTAVLTVYWGGQHRSSTVTYK